ncbi:MAG: hypothetical protein SFW63_07425 [Alphaproteobacteria bacterium]|nr:hypothetical protein [Alphaproteobacteria bacterium]
MLALIVLAPLPAHAYDFENRYGVYNVADPKNTLQMNRVCAINTAINDVPATIGAPAQYQNREQFGFVKRMVLCVKESILYATYQVLAPISEFFAQTIAIACTLAVAIWGLQATAGRRNVSTRDAAILGIKIGLVIMFTSNFAAPFFDPDNDKGGLFGMILTSMEQFIAIILRYTDNSPTFIAVCPNLVSAADPESTVYILTVWEKVDCMIETLIGGIFSPFNITLGIMGFLTAALLSGVFGFFIAIFGILIIGMLLIAIAQSVYIFISSFLAFALMVLFSPFIIPTILFAYTKPYFDKWLRVTIGLILQPIFMFVYLTMMLAAYDVLIYDGDRSVFRAIAGSAYKAHIDPSNYGSNNYMTMGQWLASPNSPAGSGRVPLGNYQPLNKNETGFTIDYAGTRPVCLDEACETERKINKRDSGVLGTIGEEINDRAVSRQNDLYDIMSSARIFRTSVHVWGINWDYLLINSKLYDADYMQVMMAWSIYNLCLQDPTFNGSMGTMFTVNCGVDPDPQKYKEKYYWPYIIGIISSMMMAVVTMFLFMVLLRALPFIGIGISGETLAVPGLGTGRLAMPGSNSFQNFQSRIANSFTGRGK